MSSVSANGQGLRLALISDTGGPAASGTTFYYNVGSQGRGFAPTNSFGPGPAGVSRLVQRWNPRELLAIGDLAYNAGGSTVQDISIGQYYNNFMYPYPSPEYLSGDYLSIGNSPIQSGKKSWPYNIYNYPAGFPNPLDPTKPGGSPDRKNHFWAALGNHDYGMEVGYGQVGVTPYNFEGKATGNPVGPSSTTSVRSAIDYFLPFLANPSLLGDDQARLNIGAVDPTGNRGAYYSITFGGTPDKPLIEFFQLDTERLNVNAGFETWNPSGMKKEQPDGTFRNEIPASKKSSYNYNPSSQSSLALAGTTDDPDNGYDQFIWLKNSLEKSKAAWKVITGHHPVYASGRWNDRQPDDHMSNPYMQRLLNALPEGSFDAYYNGHDHFYERVLESKEGGIGLGIPFITNGNSGRNLSKKIQVPYGVSVYQPVKYRGYNGANPSSNPNIDAFSYLLDSAPLQVGASGLSGDGDSVEREGFNNGLYGYGFGATRVEVDEGYLLFVYEEAAIVDPAIANHLSDGVAPELGFAGTVKEDWIPNPTGEFLGRSDLAQFKLSISNGVVTRVDLLNGGRGYMSSRGGTHVVRGFNIYGNNIDPLTPWAGTAQVDLFFVDGRLSDVRLTDGGSGYELAVNAAFENNIAVSTDNLPADRPPLVVALNYNIEETQYLVRDNSLYNDYYLITDTAIDSSELQLGAFGGLAISLAPSSRKARDLLATLPITTGYSGSGPQRSYPTPQQGSLQILDRNGTLIASPSSTLLPNGMASLQFQRRPAPGAVSVEFGGDPVSSYLVNFRESKKSLDISYGLWSSGISQTTPNVLNFSQDVNLSLARTDSVIGSVSFGLKRNGAATPSVMALMANGASSSVLTTNSIFIPSGQSSWLSSEFQSFGSFASLGSFNAGEWVPVALNGAGQELAIENLQVSGNAINVTFMGGFSALYNAPGTGTAVTLPGSGQLALTIQRLGRQNNGLAFYEADVITGAVTVNGQSFLPGDSGYLQAALASAQADQLILGPSRLPAYGSEAVITDLPLSAQQNYGLLLLRNNNPSDLVSSYSAANPGGVVSMVSFVAPNRGLVYGIEDLPFASSDHDFNDLIVGLSSANFQIA